MINKVFLNMSWILFWNFLVHFFCLRTCSLENVFVIGIPFWWQNANFVHIKTRKESQQNPDLTPTNLWRRITRPMAKWLPTGNLPEWIPYCDFPYFQLDLVLSEDYQADQRTPLIDDIIKVHNVFVVCLN